MKRLQQLFVLFLFLLLFFQSPITADENGVKIVVADFDVFLIKKQYGAMVSEVIVSKLSADSNVKVIERGKIGKIVDELALSQSGLVNPDDAVKTGKIAGATRMVVGSVGKLGVEYVVNARIIDVETGKILKGFSLSGTSENDIGAMTSTMSMLILKVLEGKDVVVPQQYQSKAIASRTMTVSESKSVHGYWTTEWYDAKGKHTGEMFLLQSGTEVKGWTIESTGPAKIVGQFIDGQLRGAYTASYGSGKLEFTLDQEGRKLLGSYTANHGVHNTWNASRKIFTQPDLLVGGLIFADWGKDIWTYPGVVTKIEGQRYFITYDDGDTEWVTKDRIHPRQLFPGEVIFVAQKSKKEYVYATVLEMNENNVTVEYADGSKKTESLSKIRLLRVRSAGY